jgi:hypothetical protein
MTAVSEFQKAQDDLLRRAGVHAASPFIDVAAVSGSVHVLVSGNGPPVVMIPGFGDPAAMWAPPWRSCRASPSMQSIVRRSG